MKILFLLVSILMAQDAGRGEVGSISGQIRETDGSPAVGMRVAAMTVEENGSVNPATATLASLSQTDDQGRYRLENIPPGRYLVTAGYLDALSYYPGIKTPPEARSIAVVAGATLPSIDFTLAYPSGVRLGGRVRMVSVSVAVDDGSPVPGPFEIQASLPGLPTSRIGKATRLADGSYELPLTVAAGIGEFVVTPTMVPLGYYVKSMSHGSVDLLRSPLRLTSAYGTTAVQMLLTKTPAAGTPGGFKINGRVTQMENALAGTPVRISVQSTQTSTTGRAVLRIGETTVKGDGTFELSGVPPGHYYVYPPESRQRSFDIADRDVTGVEIVLLKPGTSAMVIIGTSGPISTGPMLPSPRAVSTPSAPLVPPPGLAIVSVIGGAWGSGHREGALTFFRIEQSGEFLDEKRIETTPLAFTLTPGSYVLRGYSRGCDGNCGSLAAPVTECAVPFTLAANEVLYAERVVQRTDCTIRFNAPPK